MTAFQLAPELGEKIQALVDSSHKLGYQQLAVEHLLHALTDEPTAAEALKACKVDLSKLRGELEEHLKPKRQPQMSEKPPAPTEEFQRVMMRAVMRTQSVGGNKATKGVDVLLAMFGEKDSFAVRALHKQGVTRLDVSNFIMYGLKKGEARQDIRSAPSGAPRGRVERVTANNALEAFTINLNALAEEGKIDPLVGRDAEIERVVQILCRRHRNNPLLVGDSGVGKTSIAEGLALRITQKAVPASIKDAVVYSLNMGALIAGANYRGDFEKRLQDLFKNVMSTKNAILFIDGIHNIIGIDRGSGSMGASEIIKSTLSTGSVRCIGATSFTDYRNIFEKDSSLSRCFQKVDVEEPTVEETVEILKGLKSRFEDHHKVKYEPQALRAAAELAARYINDRKLPDKAIDVIDEAGAAHRAVSLDETVVNIGCAEIENVVSKIAHVPVANVNQDDRAKLRDLESSLKTVVFGQDAALEELAASVKMSRSGLGKANQPIGSFLFSGPTGVGKTEAARQLANILGVELLRFDMSEYMERHTVSRLVGSPPGYIGYDKGGQLTEAVAKTPHCVLLLDEIEKAHPDIFNVLLQVMDNGTLTDAVGRKVDFRNVILILTTNAGAETTQRNTIGFMSKREVGDEMVEIKRTFTPEFRNRLDAIVSFKPLGEDVILRVVDKFLLQLEQQLSEKNVEVSFSNELRGMLAKKGFDPLMGARPMQRLIQNTIRKPLADELLFGGLADGGNLCVDVDGEGKVTFNITPYAQLEAAEDDGDEDNKVRVDQGGKPQEGCLF